MRVVSGRYKGKALKAVPGNSTRPTTDKVKEAIFNIIGPYFNGGICLDLFAGSGGLGIEALSRGAEKAIFVDRDGKAIHTIYDNLKTCDLESRAEVYRNDFKRALKAIRKREISFDYIFLDPPYAKQQLQEILEIIDTNTLLNNEGVIVCEHSSEVEMPKTVGHLTQIKEETYGIITISIYSWSS
ncbi:16S rRNA (guanine(966)-N(2))-methyltransferase RsmD [Robertmurraya andreesenii]|uniref:16S rRNA (Guanine(966)-N(2))-methyltransferase RsmD n=1 Tax=Anoxybacillus andreesenii TaxID=1325932 RepID=A0ABT9V4M5_9BACL|nr:16S rRNA (guanine(966)-N(2))-methyltransferase RsmD [Robertmurraya andreesenii]MDQ0155893.1 16S rRNA (guanine(966)-N(2))-methyltransferase RsmD [Robertmurraya andreesenii]